MEETLQFNQQIVDEIKQVLRYLAENKEHIDWQRLYRLISTAEQLKYTQLSGTRHSAVNHTAALLSWQIVTPVSEYCGFSESAPSKTDIQVCCDSWLCCDQCSMAFGFMLFMDCILVIPVCFIFLHL